MMKNGDNMWQLRKKIHFVYTLVGILSTPSFRGASTSGMPTEMPFGMVTVKIIHITPLSLEMRYGFPLNESW